MQTSPILEKLTKLFNMAESGEGHEAEVASQRAAELMAKHGVTAAEVIAAKGRSHEIPLEDGRIDGDQDGKPQRVINGWKKSLAAALVHNLGGDVLVIGLRTGGVILRMVGPQDSVTAARYLYTYLTKELERRVRRYLKETGGKGPQGNAYLQGAVIQIAVRMAEGRRVGTEGASSQAMVLVNKAQEASKAKLRGDYGKIKEHKTRIADDPVAKLAGFQEAADLDLLPPDRKLS